MSALGSFGPNKKPRRGPRGKILPSTQPAPLPSGGRYKPKPTQAQAKPRIAPTAKKPDRYKKPAFSKKPVGVGGKPTQPGQKRKGPQMMTGIAKAFRPPTKTGSY